MKHLISLLLVIVVLALLAGCQPMGERIIDVPECLGKADIADAVRVLSLQRQNVRSFKSRADCTVYFKNSEGQLKPEGVDATIRFVPPTKIYFKGDKFGEIRLGTNDTEFWLRIKPDMDTYWYGSKALAAECSADLPVNPDAIAEALGVVDVTTDWTLFHRDGYDLLDYAEDGNKRKRLYVDACTYLIRRIEYFDRAGALIASAELSEYSTGEDHGIVVPTRIYVANYDSMGLESDSIEIKLKHIAPFTPTEKQLQKMFARPERDGYESMRELTDNCEFELVAD